MNNRENKNNRFEAYPRPNKTDEQLKNQPEFIDDNREEIRDQDIRRTSSTEEPKEERRTEKEE